MAIGILIVEIYSGFSLSRDLARLLDQRFMGLYRHECIKVSYHSVKFGGHKHCCSEDIFIIICHVIL